MKFCKMNIFAAFLVAAVLWNNACNAQRYEETIIEMVNNTKELSEVTKKHEIAFLSYSKICSYFSLPKYWKLMDFTKHC